jgi:proteasome lid subunit RPN8/RPN11
MSDPILSITPDSLSAMQTHARESYPDECCGVVIAPRGGKQLVVPLRNVQDAMHAKDPERYPRTARTAYTPHAGEFKRAVDLWEAPGSKLVAFYHSHPDHDAYFSDEDVRQATPFGEPSYPEALQIVVSVYDGKVKEVKAFRWSASSERFEEVARLGG